MREMQIFKSDGKYFQTTMDEDLNYRQRPSWRCYLRQLATEVMNTQLHPAQFLRDLLRTFKAISAIACLSFLLPIKLNFSCY